MGIAIHLSFSSGIMASNHVEAIGIPLNKKHALIS